MNSNSAFAQQFKAQPADVRATAAEERDALWVSLVCVDGVWIGVSRYGDPSWLLAGSTRNVNRAKRRIDFDAVPTVFQQLARAFLYRYQRRGVSGGKRPGPASMMRMFYSLVPFLRYLAESGVHRLSKVDEETCAGYITHTKAHKKSNGAKPTDALLATSTLGMRFKTVEQLYELSQYTDDPMTSNPWEGESAAGLAGKNGLSGGKTPLIPDVAFVSLFQAASQDIERGETVLRLRDDIQAIERKYQGKSSTTIRKHQNRHLDSSGWVGGLAGLNEAAIDLRTACYAVVSSVTGCRIHELASVAKNACYATADDDDEPYWWMKGVSTKTDAGDTEWMIPEVGVTALRLMEWWARPYLAVLRGELARLRKKNPLDPLIAEAAGHQDALFLGAPAHAPDIVRTISTETWNENLNRYARKHSIDWVFASHQFRRKFANYAARSKFGDLRYLKEHYKHWAMDMTLAYALNESQEMELFLEIEEELIDIKRGVVRDWLDPSEPLAGGYGSNLVAWRGQEALTLFKDHKSMVIAIADSTAIRSNGHSWCTADDDLCVGNDMEPTRCTGCDSAVVSRLHAHIYKGMYDELKGLLSVPDIGPGGAARLQRDLGRCRSTLARLGHDVEETVQ